MMRSKPKPLQELLVGEQLQLAFGCAILRVAADDLEEIVIDPLLAIRAGVIVGTDLAVEVEADADRCPWPADLQGNCAGLDRWGNTRRPSRLSCVFSTVPPSGYKALKFSRGPLPFQGRSGRSLYLPSAVWIDRPMQIGGHVADAAVVDDRTHRRPPSCRRRPRAPAPLSAKCRTGQNAHGSESCD